MVSQILPLNWVLSLIFQLLRMICTNFDVYNERVALKEAIENNKQHTVHFSECILVDQICWKRDNIILYNKLKICLSGK